VVRDRTKSLFTALRFFCWPFARDSRQFFIQRPRYFISCPATWARIRTKRTLRRGPELGKIVNSHPERFSTLLAGNGFQQSPNGPNYSHDRSFHDWNLALNALQFK
jgi:hypothetical protein